MDRPTLSLRERDRRWASVRALLQDRNADCLIVVGLSGLWQFDIYVANEHADGIVIFPRDGEPTYLTWTPAYITRHNASNDRLGNSWVENWKLGITGKALAAELKAQGFAEATIGIVGLAAGGTPIEPDGWVPYGTWADVLAELSNANFLNLTASFIELMLVRSDEELAMMRYAANVGELACGSMLETIREGGNENEIFAAVTGCIYAHGCNPDPGPFLHVGYKNLSWGYSQWLSQGQAARTLMPGDVAQAEIFVNYGGIQSQQQMSVALGPVEEVCHELAAVARASYDAGLSALRPGKTFQEVSDAMIAPLQAANCWQMTPLIHSLSPNFLVGHLRIGAERMPGHNAGHGIKPLPPFGGERVIKPGMIFELEPNACLGSWRINIGGTVIVGENGPEPLNELPTRMNLIEGYAADTAASPRT